MKFLKISAVAICLCVIASAFGADEDVAIPDQLLDLAAKLQYPASVCAITNLDDAPKKCLPGEIFWYAPESWQMDQKLSPLGAAANFCDLNKTVLYDEKALVCIYNRNNLAVSRELGIRVSLPAVTDLEQQYTNEFTRILNSDPKITRLDENMWVQVVNEGTLRGNPFTEGDQLWVEFHMLSPRLQDEGHGHFFKVYSYYEAEHSYFLSMLRQFWDQINADLLVYSDLSLLPQEILDQDLFGSNIPRAYHVIFRKVVSKENLKGKAE